MRLDNTRAREAGHLVRRDALRHFFITLSARARMGLRFSRFHGPVE